jgi:signal transduction histidine kinase
MRDCTLPGVYDNRKVMKRTLACFRPRVGWAPVVSRIGTLAIACCGSLTAAAGRDFNHRLALRVDPRLPAVEQRLRAISGEMAKLPVLTDMDALGSHGFHSDFTVDSEGNWFELSWETPRMIDGIALVPTRLTTQSGDMSNYGFPNRIRVEGALPGGKERVVIAELTDSHLDFRRGDPVFFAVPPNTVQALRVIPIDLPKFPGKQVRFFSVSEIMAFQGDRNIAPEGSLSAPFSIEAEVGWNLRYLIDGQTPLGPPEVPPPSLSLGWHADIAADGKSSTWAAIDLGEDRPFDAVRLIAARGDSPVKGPGFGFPVNFSIKICRDAEPGDWETIVDTGADDFPNPGYNPVTLRFPRVSARHVRLDITGQHQPDRLTAPRVLLSEMEVLDGMSNLALGKPVSTADASRQRPHDARRVWSVDGLTDGHSSTGRLIPLRQWVEDLSHRFDLALEQRALVAERDAILARTHKWSLIALFAMLSSTIIGLVIWQARLRLAGQRRIRELRRRISSDLHDEVGSNLATIALLSEMDPAGDGAEHLGDISRMARESSQSLREIVDLTIAPNRARKPLPERIREIAALMLKDHVWEFTGDATPNLDPEQRRNFVFFIKEALHNISRHAHASHVALAFEAHDSQALLRITDNGRGLPPPPPAGQPRLRALEQRAKSLHGSLAIESAPGNGTSLILRFPLRI